MSDLVKPFMYGNHLHYLDMPPCATCSAENDAWDGMRNTYGDLKLAEKVARSEGGRKFAGKYTFDHIERPLSLDVKIDEVMSDDTFISDMGDGHNLHEDIASKNAVDKFADTLTPMQRKVLYQLLEGYDAKDIFESFNYATTGGIRFHRMNIRKALREYDFNEFTQED